MRYGDLVQFDPIETIIQLRDADKEARAEKLVSSYVISDEMAERLEKLVFPQLQFHEPVDNKGLLIVGNYGTGKSHLMSVISAVAERGELVASLRNPAVAEAAASIAGQFKVLRIELSTKMSLRDAITTELEEYLAGIGVDFPFPPADTVVNSKEALEDMMGQFAEVYPDQGLLIVVDELLDYLRTRSEQQLAFDLSFLRELGEGVRDLRLRFVAGIQEMLFENPRFAFTADSLRRVKDRFEQVYIARQDVKYVVAERLLQKTVEQQALIREHLEPFTPFYGHMNERLDEFVRLFPIHPDYIDTFERISAIEKREVLKTLSLAMKEKMGEVVPTDQPGLIAYDSYWDTLLGNPSYRMIPDVRDVVEASQVLENRIDQAFTRPDYTPMAHRIIHGLSVHRLTQRDINAPIGATPEELRDGLTLYEPMAAELGGDPADDLLSHVETVLNEIVRTVSGQFISYNPDNRQYYLDLKKTEDYDAIIASRAESLDKETLDRYYFEALKQAMEFTDQPSTFTGYRIWNHEVEWREHRAERQGYLFFGTPNERSTAVPPREFYLYFIQPYAPPRFKDEKEADEVFFKLARQDDKFDSAIKRYAAAMEMASRSSSARRAYEMRAHGALNELVKWLQENLATAYEVTHQGKARTVAEWLKGGTSSAASRASVRDLVNAVSSTLLSSHFQDKAPEYPKFLGLISHRNREQAAQDALRYLNGATQSQQARAVLGALELLDGATPSTSESRYAQAVLTRLRNKGTGQVLNRSELLENVSQVEYFMPNRYRLEPELLVVVLAALVYTGELTLSAASQNYNANDMESLARTPVDTLVDFKHVQAPKEWNLPALEALAELVDMTGAQARLITQGNEDTVKRLNANATSMVEQIVRLLQQLQGGLLFWGRPVLSDAETADYKQKLDELKGFLESLQAYNTSGKLKNFRHGLPEVRAQQGNVAALKGLLALQALVADLSALSTYLSQAEVTVPDGLPWKAKAKQVKDDLLVRLGDPTQRTSATMRQTAVQQLEAVKKSYIQAYSQQHARSRLGLNDDKRKEELLGDARLGQLRRMASVELMPTGQLRDFEDRLVNLASCFSLTEAELQTAPLCVHCQFRLSETATNASLTLTGLDSELDGLVDTWAQTLRNNLNDPTAQAAADLLRVDEKALIAQLLGGDALPDIDQELVRAINKVLSGLTRVEMSLGGLREALTEGGVPASPEELRKRFEAYLARLVDGQSADKVRIVIE